MKHTDLKKMTTKNLVELFIMTESMPNTPELPTVRGWMQKRTPALRKSRFCATPSTCKSFGGRKVPII